MLFGKTVSDFNYCDEEIESQMITIALINFGKNFTEVGVPYLMKFLKKNKKDKVKSNEVEKNDQIYKLRKSLETENDLDDFNKGYIDETFNDYLEIVIQFGFVSLFAMSFSLLPIIAYITNLFEIQVDKTKLLNFYKRPNPNSASSIGNWYMLFELLSFISIFTNVGILIFTYNNYYGVSGFWKAFAYMIICFFYIILKIVISRLIPDHSAKTDELIARHSFIIEKNCDGLDKEPLPQKVYKLNLNAI